MFAGYWVGVRHSNAQWPGLLALICICIVMCVLSTEACLDHVTEKASTQIHNIEKSQMAHKHHDANERAWEYIEQNLIKSETAVRPLKIRQMSQSGAVDTFWMKAALSAAMDCYGPCPPLAYGSVLVNKTSGLSLMRSCNTVYVDSTNHAEMNTMQLAAHYYPGHTPQWWNELTLYTTAEPCAMCMAAARWVGIGEIVYGTSIDTQTSYGWNSIHISASAINAASYGLSTSATLAGPFATSLTDPYFAWQANPKQPCPVGCVRYSVNSTRCISE